MKLYHPKAAIPIDTPPHRVEAMGRKGWFPKVNVSIELDAEPILNTVKKASKSGRLKIQDNAAD